MKLKTGTSQRTEASHYEFAKVGQGLASHYLSFGFVALEGSIWLEGQLVPMR